MKSPFPRIVLATVALAGCAPLGRLADGFRSPDAGCRAPAAFTAAAGANAASLQSLAWSPFGRPERGWAIYAPRLRREIKTRCPPDSAGFAAHLARWQGAHALAATGVLDEPTFQAVKTRWQSERPFIATRAAGVCPDPPPAEALAVVPPDEAYPGKTVLLRRAAAGALRRMLNAAWAEAPATARGPDRLVVFSGYRDPAHDAERCERDGDCDGVARAACSSHRTGLAIDLMLGAAPGYAVDSAADANRLYQSRTPAYQWLVNNAARFGFVNYPFEPWHWEWTGEAP